MPELISAQLYAHGLAGLLKDYAAKLESLREEVRIRSSDWGLPVSGNRRWAGLRDRYKSLVTPLLNVTRTASELAEQGDVGDLEILELRLRLADVESLLKMVASELNP